MSSGVECIVLLYSISGYTFLSRAFYLLTSFQNSFMSYLAALSISFKTLSRYLSDAVFWTQRKISLAVL